MEKATSAKELNVVLVGSKSSHEYLVGNTILGRRVFNSGYSASSCEREDGDVCGRRVTLVKALGWLRGYRLCDTPELFKTKTILSVTLCPPGLHGFILVINIEQPFKNVHKKATQEHLQHFFGDKVWDHTIVVFNHRGHLSNKTIEDYIKSNGAPLQSLLEACGNRYHILCDDGTDNDVKVKELFEKIDAMVAENSCYETDSTLMQSAESKRKDVDKKAEELRLQSQQQRQKLRNLLTEPTPSLRILMVGWVFSGKSAAGNTILSADVFQSGGRTEKALKQSGWVAGRDVVIVDTPGSWKFFPARFSPSFLKPEILKGVSLCSPSPNVILLTVPLDTAFTDEQRRVTEGNMRLLGQRAWRHVIVLFTFGDILGDKTVEQHIESEGKPLRWLIDKCGNRYHVLNNTIAADDQVTELLKKMEEMVAGNSSFYISDHRETDDPQPEEERSDNSTENKDENTSKEIIEQLIIEWDRRYWETHQISKGNKSMGLSINFCDEQKSDASEGEEAQMEHRREDDQTCFDLEVASEDVCEEQLNIERDRRNWETHQISKGNKSMELAPEFCDEHKSDASEGEEAQMEQRREDDQTCFDLEVTSEDDAASGSLNMWIGLLEREWSRREVAVEQASWTHSYNPVCAATSEPDTDELLKSREKVKLWLKTRHPISGYGTASNISWKLEEENENEKISTLGRAAFRHRQAEWLPMGPLAGGARMRRKSF